ncbi:MAG: hypothetical protein ACXWT3_00960 [Methylococcaceae bacterium]
MILLKFRKVKMMVFTFLETLAVARSGSRFSAILPSDQLLSDSHLYRVSQ